MSVAPRRQPVKLFVGNLPEDAESEEIRTLFETFGHVLECTVMMRQNYAFVIMEDEDEAKLAISTLKNQTYRDYIMDVQFSHSSPRQSYNVARTDEHNNIPQQTQTNQKSPQENLSPKSHHTCECSCGSHNNASKSSPAVGNVNHSTNANASTLPLKRPAKSKAPFAPGYFPTQEAITYVKEEILNDPIARLMLLYDLLAIIKESQNRLTSSTKGANSAAGTSGTGATSNKQTLNRSSSNNSPLQLLNNLTANFPFPVAPLMNAMPQNFQNLIMQNNLLMQQNNILNNPSMNVNNNFNSMPPMHCGSNPNNFQNSSNFNGFFNGEHIKNSTMNPNEFHHHKIQPQSQNPT